VGLTAICVLAAGTYAVAQDRTITTAVSIEQNQLAAGAYTNNQVLQSGRQFFAVSFLPADGHGEGPNGPRSQQRLDLWSPSTPFPLSIPFLRVNGLDSQSCFACHNTAGTAVPEHELFSTQKPGGVGGAGDFAVALLGSADFPDPLTHILRAPPRAFGSAYLQELALEMTRDLHGIEQQATAQAATQPGIPVTAALSSKGVSYGSITITCPTSTCNNPTRDTSAVDGVSPDLIVRPLQHKGVAATLRSFVKSALNFHHSMQAVEVVGINTDCDDDGLINELAVDNVNPVSGVNSTPVQQSLGNVAALSAFTGMLRPPGVAPSSGSADKGKEIFVHVGCADCHKTSLTTRRDPKFRIELAAPAKGCPGSCSGYGCLQLGSFAEADAAVHPAMKTVNQQAKAISSSACPSGFYCMDLTNPGAVPPEFYPRLPANHDGTVTVPLYSDLKRHDMGQFLTQVDPQQADDSGNLIPNREWLTSKLWGVRDNGPWIHDGRARTLREAILMHAGADGTATDSDASPVIANYLALPLADQQAVVDFLETLTIPNP
jgi:hypothetical protein